MRKKYNVILKELREDHDLKQAYVAKLLGCLRPGTGRTQPVDDPSS